MQVVVVNVMQLLIFPSDFTLCRFGSILTRVSNPTP